MIQDLMSEDTGGLWLPVNDHIILEKFHSLSFSMRNLGVKAGGGLSHALFEFVKKQETKVCCQHSVRR